MKSGEEKKSFDRYVWGLSSPIMQEKESTLRNSHEVYLLYYPFLVSIIKIQVTFYSCYVCNFF